MPLLALLALLGAFGSSFAADTGDTGDTGGLPESTDSGATAEETYDQGGGCQEGTAAGALFLAPTLLGLWELRRNRR